MAAHVGGESTAFGAPSEPREGAEESHFEGVVGVVFWIICGTYFRRFPDTKWIPECDQNGALVEMGDLARV